MLAAALVDHVHDGAHHLRMSHCHLLLATWNIPLGPGEPSPSYSSFNVCHGSQNYYMHSAPTSPQTKKGLRKPFILKSSSFYLV